jgi:hypothetical protein
MVAEIAVNSTHKRAARRRHYAQYIRMRHMNRMRKQKRSLEYWRKQPTEAIIPSLKPGLEESLKVKPDGAIMNGNTRVKVLQERGFDVNMLPRESYGRAFSIGEQLDVEAPVGGGGGLIRIFPDEE